MSASDVEMSGEASQFEAKRWQDLSKILGRTGPLATSSFSPSEENLQKLHETKILVIGAGGLGCELLKDLALSGFRDIHVIDMDTIDLSNLNRQFLFREADVGGYKAEVAARFVMERVPGCVIVPHRCRIQEKDTSFYRQFSIVIAGLDNIEARRWLSAKLVGMVDSDDNGDPDFETMIPMIDGGTEGFKGQARLILPRHNACFECMLDIFPEQVNFPLCTIANTPRLPEHCVEYASIMLWPKEFPEKKLDGDDPEHVRWIYDQALARAQTFGIQGVTYRFAQGVMKRIIPAVASTNAIIAAACSNEAFKWATNATLSITDLMLYYANDGLYTHTYEIERKADCPVCSEMTKPLQIAPESTLQQLVDLLISKPDIGMDKPNLKMEGKTLYMRFPPSLEEQTRANLSKTLNELGVNEGDSVDVTQAGKLSVSISIKFPKKDADAA